MFYLFLVIFLNNKNSNELCLIITKGPSDCSVAEATKKIRAEWIFMTVFFGERKKIINSYDSQF